MSIRFKFRSSVNFDTIEIDGAKPYISVRDLRSKILCQNKLKGVCHKDFDLVFFDNLTGQEYKDDEFRIPSGSSVIIKRVPAEPVPSDMLRHHKHEASELSEDVPKVAAVDHNKMEEIVIEKNPATEDHEHIRLDKVANSEGIDLQKVDLPSELRCPICITYFKEAVMIPCCQHSFCKKCICEVLPQTARCPKCSSTKYRVEHLLPNLSLRHAIEHFLESQILAAAPETNLQKYVPDGESGIQGKEVSVVTKRNLDMIYSTSAMDKGSNQNMADSVYESLNRKNVFFEGTRFDTDKSYAIDLLKSSHLQKVTNSNGGRDNDLTRAVDSQGENQPVMPQVCVPDEADSTSRKKGPWVNTGGGDRSYAVDNRNKQTVRTCYKCGSPGHFIRDCPMLSDEVAMASRSYTGDHMFQGGMPGYAMPYWNPAAFHVNPYMNMYGNPGVLPFNAATMVPATPYGVPPYAPSAYGSLAVPSGNTRMGGLGQRAEQPLRHPESFEQENNDKRIKYPNEKRQRSSDYEDNGIQKHHDYHEPERSSKHKSHRDGGKVMSNSEDSHERRLQKNHENMRSGHTKYEKRSHGSYHSHTDRSVSGVEDVHSGDYRYDEGRHKKYYESSKRRHTSSWEQSDSDGSCGLHQTKEGKHVKRRRMDDRNRKKPVDDELYSDRWKMVNKGDSEDNYHHKRR